jgi:hypothetical protein
MNCGCTKHIGCFTPNQTIDFGINAPFGDDYTFQIWSNSGYFEQTFTFSFGEAIQIPFTFNENSTTTIKIKINTYGVSGLMYLTSDDGACSFEVSGLVPTC